MKTNRILKPVPIEDIITRPQFAIDEPYRKPTHRMPYFEDTSKRVPELSALKLRQNELKKRKKVKEVVCLGWWDRVLKSLVK